jgi:hypothetical protein
LSYQTASAQLFTKPDYPLDFFRNPLNIPILLAGNFGEIRPGHIHMGLDVKTNGKVNQPVYAAADGYVARIKIEPGGFGRAIYINHPNGYTTVYAHLNNFFPALESWVKQQQYQQESWQIFPDLSPTLFPVKKGQFIAWSGTTGGSAAPHLHFEVRQTADDVNLNPYLFGLPLKDNISPRLLRLAVYNRTKSTYEQTPRMILVKKTKKGYAITPSLVNVASPLISFGVSTYDLQNGAPNKLGVFECDLYVDNRPVTGFRMNKISYNDTRNVNGHIDYKTRSLRGPTLQHLSNLPGYLHSIYNTEKGNGVINLGDKKVHVVKILVGDAFGNEATLQFRIKYNGAVVKPGTDTGKMFYPLMLDGLETSDCEFYIGEHCLYDSAHIQYRRSEVPNAQVVSATQTIGETYIPLQESFLIRIRPNRPVPDSMLQKVVMRWAGSGDNDVQKVEWQNGWATARFRNFGSFRLEVDTIAPQIIPIGFNEGSDLSKAADIKFVVRDNLGAYKNVRPELDGKWLRFTNDKGRAFVYQFDEKCPPGPHELKISVSDEAGNRTVKTFHFNR